MNLRSPTLDEAGEVAALLNVHARALTGKDDTSEGEIRLWFGSPELDLAQDVWVAVEDGALVAYADAADWGHSRTSFWIDLRAHPERGETALPALIDRGEARVAEWMSESPARERLTLRAVVLDGDEMLRRVLEERGYRSVRYSFEMEIDVGDSTEEPSWPDRIVARRFASGDDAGAVFETVNDAFADTWEFRPDSYEEFAHYWFESETYDPDLWILAMDGEEIAGASLCRAHRAGDPELGWVSSLGVRRAWRRRGLGRALLLESFRAFHTRGLPRVGLGVDAENPTGATRLYESVGMRVTSRRAIFEKELRAAEVGT